MTYYRYNRPITGLLALTLPVWAPLWCIFDGSRSNLKEMWAERAYIGRETKDALRWALEPVAEAWGGLRSFVKSKVDDIRLRLMIAQDQAADFYRAQVHQRLVACLIMLFLFPLTAVGVALIAATTSIVAKNLNAFRAAWREGGELIKDFVDVLKTGEA